MPINLYSKNLIKIFISESGAVVIIGDVELFIFLHALVIIAVQDLAHDIKQ